VETEDSIKPREYFRKDRKEGITPPDLTKSCSVAEHIVRARGKRTNFTSVSLDLSCLRDLGEAEYQLKRLETERDGHLLIEHDALMRMLYEICRTNDKHERVRALQAIRYARARLEGLVNWTFDISGIDRKDVINWVFPKIQPYFSKV
jgi:hypothetical protein